MYNHYIALDWAKSNMALARTTLNSDKVSVFEGFVPLYGLIKEMEEEALRMNKRARRDARLE